MVEGIPFKLENKEQLKEDFIDYSEMCLSTSFHKTFDMNASFIIQQTCKVNNCIYEFLTNKNYHLDNFSSSQTLNNKLKCLKTTVNKLSTSLIPNTSKYTNFHYNKNRHLKPLSTSKRMETNISYKDRGLFISEMPSPSKCKIKVNEMKNIKKLKYRDKYSRTISRKKSKNVNLLMKTQLIWNPLSSQLTYFHDSSFTPVNPHRKIISKSSYETGIKKTDVNYVLEKEASELKLEFQNFNILNNQAKLPNGYYISKEGDIYKGNIINDKRHGFGLCVFKNGQIYKGDWENDNSKGFGILKTIFNFTYEGEFSNGFKIDSGEIAIYYQNGDYYKGESRNLKKNGHGIYYWKNGDIIEGEWQDDERHGDCTIKFASKAKYVGEFRNDNIKDLGKYIDNKGNEIEAIVSEDEKEKTGSFQSGKLNGKGRVTFIDKYTYIGNFKDGTFSGLGELKFNEGNNSDIEIKYIGEFMNNKRLFKLGMEKEYLNGERKENLREFGKMIIELMVK